VSSKRKDREESQAPGSRKMFKALRVRKGLKGILETGSLEYKDTREQ